MTVRLIAIMASLLTSFIVIALNSVITAIFGLNLFSFSLIIFIPVGAMLSAVLCCAGFWWVWRTYGATPAMPDQLFLCALCFALPFLIQFGHYVNLLIHHPQIPFNWDVFTQFMTINITESKHYFHSRHMPNDSGGGEAGAFGWLLLLPQLGGVLAIARWMYLQAGGKTKSYSE